MFKQLIKWLNGVNDVKSACYLGGDAGIHGVMRYRQHPIDSGFLVCCI